MDTWLYNGDHGTGGRGLPVTLTGSGEMLQRALIRLTVRKGSFGPDPRLGSELHRLSGAPEAVLDRVALSYVQEALEPMTGMEVAAVRCRREGDGSLLVTAALGWQGETYELEVEAQ